MARISYVEKDNAPPEVKAIYEPKLCVKNKARINIYSLFR